MGTIIRDSAPKLFITGLRKVVADALSQLDWMYPWMFSVSSSVKRYEEDYSMFGIFNVPELVEGQNYPIADVTTGYDKIYTHLLYGLILRYGIVAKEDELYGFLSKFPSYLTKATKHTVDQIATDVFNNAGTTTGPDGVYLISTTHPALGGGTHANTPTVQIDLSYTALEAACVALLARKTFEGHYMNQSESYRLMYPPALDPMVEKLRGSKQQPFSADNTVNYLFGKFEPKCNPYITNSKAYYILSAPNDNGAKFFWRVKPSMKEFVDNNNDDTSLRTRFRFSCGITDWREAIPYAGINT